LFFGLSPENNKNVNLCDLCGAQLSFVENPAGYLTAQFQLFSTRRDA